MTDRLARSRFEESIEIDIGAGVVRGTIAVPEPARGCVIFAHGGGSGRNSPRNRFIASALHQAGIATLLVDLWTANEGSPDAAWAERSESVVDALAERLLAATNWLAANFEHHNFRIGYFAANSGAATALVAAARRPSVAAVVARGGRPDLAGAALSEVQASVLLIVGGKDRPLIKLNREALAQLNRAQNKELRIIPGARHLFKEAGALDEVARLASQWFGHYLGAAERQGHQHHPHFNQLMNKPEFRHDTPKVDRTD